ncbi:hypothetical protein HaLaN_12782, partial [Haematococcus lacustris]
HEHGASQRVQVEPLRREQARLPWRSQRERLRVPSRFSQRRGSEGVWPDAGPEPGHRL